MRCLLYKEHEYTLRKRGSFLRTKQLYPIVVLLATAILLTACSSTSTTVAQTKKTNSAQVAHSLTAEGKKLFPNGITLVVNLPPGGVSYTDGAEIQPYLQKVLGVPVTVRPIVGGSGNTAAEYVYHAAPNSGILMMSLLPQLAIGQLLGGGKYNTLSYTPLGGIFGNDTSLYVAKYGSPYRNFASLQHAQGTLTVGEFGVKSSAGWMSTVFLKKINHINIKGVPFGNAAQSMDAVLSGAVDLASVTAAQALKLMQAKRVQPVVDFAPKPLSYLPNVNSIGQVGNPDEAFTLSMGVVGPPGMSPHVSKILSQALLRVSENPEFQSKARKMLTMPVYLSATAWGALTHQEYDMVHSKLSMLQ